MWEVLGFIKDCMWEINKLSINYMIGDYIKE